MEHPSLYHSREVPPEDKKGNGCVSWVTREWVCLMGITPVQRVRTTWRSQFEDGLDLWGQGFSCRNLVTMGDKKGNGHVSQRPSQVPERKGRGNRWASAGRPREQMPGPGRAAASDALRSARLSLNLESPIQTPGTRYPVPSVTGDPDADRNVSSCHKWWKKMLQKRNLHHTTIRLLQTAIFNMNL